MSDFMTLTTPVANSIVHAYATQLYSLIAAVILVLPNLRVVQHVFWYTTRPTTNPGLGAIAPLLFDHVASSSVQCEFLYNSQLPQAQPTEESATIIARRIFCSVCC